MDHIQPLLVILTNRVTRHARVSCSNQTDLKTRRRITQAYDFKHSNKTNKLKPRFLPELYMHFYMKGKLSFYSIPGIEF